MLDRSEADTRLFHQANAIAPVEAGVTVSSVTIAKLRLLQDRWEAARGRGLPLGQMHRESDVGSGST